MHLPVMIGMQQQLPRSPRATRSPRRGIKILQNTLTSHYIPEEYISDSTNMKLALASSFLLALAAAASSSDPTCECQPFPPKHTSYQVTRLWNIIDPSMTDQDVIDEFNEGFAPIVTHMEGFQRYTASSTGNSTTVFFLNEFATKEEAHVAQEAAKEFVANGKLNGKISPNIFTEAKGLAGFPLEGCIKDSSKGQFLAVRFYHYLDPTSVNTTTLYPLLKEFYDKSLRDKDGFVTYYSALNPPNDGNDGISWDIFESEEAAIASNEGNFEVEVVSFILIIIDQCSSQIV